MSDTGTGTAASTGKPSAIMRNSVGRLSNGISVNVGGDHGNLGDGRSVTVAVSGTAVTRIIRPCSVALPGKGRTPPGICKCPTTGTVGGSFLAFTVPLWVPFRAFLGFTVPPQVPCGPATGT